MKKKGALLLNLGSPDSTKVEDVKRYLEEFLMDERVLEMPEWKRKLILKLFILPKRPAESAEAYSEVWTEQGSPLIVTSEEQQRLVQEQLEMPVFLGMRYGNPSTKDVVAEIKKAGVEELFILPLYPHYAMSSFESAVVRAMEEIQSQAPHIKVTVQQPFYDEEAYIDALWASIEPHLEEGDHLMMSYHGIPEKHVRISDPTNAHCLSTPNCCECPNPAHATCYRHQCYATSAALMKKGGLVRDNVTISFQSRLLKDPWLSPYTDFEIERLAKEGVKKLKVICPAFITDCLETLEEIAMQGAESFKENGGEELELIPCLNTHPQWIKWMVDKINDWDQVGTVQAVAGLSLPAGK